MKRIYNKRSGYRLNNRGFSLVELLISIAVLVIIMVPLMGNFIRSMQINKKSERYQIQSNLAASIMEGLKASTTREIIDSFNSPKELFSIIPNRLDDITRLEQISEDEYVETSLDEEQTTSFFAIHGVIAGCSAYDVFIRLDASVYKGEEDKLNNFLMPEVINLDEKANGLFFSDGSSVNGAGVEDSDQLALNSFTQQGTQYAITTLHQSEEYIEYLKEYAIWRNECEVASMKGEPLPPRWFAEPTLEDLDLEKYTDPNEIMKYVTKNMNITVSDTLVSYEIEYICDWWSQIRITHSIDQVEYADTIENIYLFYKQSAFHEAHAPGDGYNADRIRLTNNDTSKNIKFFVADQKNILNNPVLITRTPGDSIAVFTNLSSYEAYAGSSTDTTVNMNLMNTYELNRIYEIRIDICKPETDQANRYKEVYYSLKSTKEQ